MPPASLSRRHFLGNAATGLSGVALASLFSRDAAAAKQAPIRPVVRPEAPMAARAPHFAPRAKQVLCIFCSGAISHVDTFDYKPELVKRDGQPAQVCLGADRRKALRIDRFRVADLVERRHFLDRSSRASRPCTLGSVTGPSGCFANGYG